MLQPDVPYDHEALDSKKCFRTLFFRVKVQANFLKRLHNFFAKNEKAETSNLLAKLISMNRNYMFYSSVHEIWENLIEIYSMKKNSATCYDIESKIFNSK
ncbi:hypothetical protein CR513_23028, partial [Mucuna pruriens]